MTSVPVQFLVESGSTLTLISYDLLMKMCTDKELKLQRVSVNLKVLMAKNLKHMVQPK
jgi:hypothetical protein